MHSHDIKMTIAWCPGAAHHYGQRCDTWLSAQRAMKQRNRHTFGTTKYQTVQQIYILRQAAMQPPLTLSSYYQGHAADCVCQYETFETVIALDSQKTVGIGDVFSAHALAFSLGTFIKPRSADEMWTTSCRLFSGADYSCMNRPRARRLSVRPRRRL